MKCIEDNHKDAMAQGFHEEIAMPCEPLCSLCLRGFIHLISHW